MKHIDGPTCPSCEDKLAQADDRIAKWFRTSVKTKYLSAHISCSFRGEVDQETAFNHGASKLHWPESAHNRMVDGKPCATALDLFEQVDGKAYYRPKFYNAINLDNQNNGPSNILWGGEFKSLGDCDHFQLLLPK